VGRWLQPGSPGTGIVAIAAVLGIVVHPILWVIVIAAVLWLFVRRGSRSRV
jgi:hypothetical protein